MLLLCLAWHCCASAGAAEDAMTLQERVFGKRAAAVRSLQLEVRLDGDILGTIAVELAQNGLQSIDGKAFAALLSPILQPNVEACLQVIGVPAVPADIASCGMTLSYDPAELGLVLQLPVSMRVVQELSVRERPSLPTQNLRQGTHSGLINLSLAQSWRDGRQQLGLGLDGAVNWQDFTLEFDGACSDGQCLPGLRSLVHDQPETQRRCRVGDLSDVRAGQIALPHLQGLGCRRLFELTPEQTFTANMALPLELASDSVVEVFDATGFVLQRLQLPPGRYALSDFPLSPGPNDAVVRVSDVAGRTHTFELSTWVDFELLGEGRSRYGWSVARPTLAVMLAGRSNQQPWSAALEYELGLAGQRSISLGMVSIPEFNRHGLVQAAGDWIGNVRSNFSLGESCGVRLDLALRNTPEQSAWRHEFRAGWQSEDWQDPFALGSTGKAYSAYWRTARAIGERWQWAWGAGASRSNAGIQRRIGMQIAGRVWQRAGLRMSIERSISSSMSDWQVSVGWNIPIGDPGQSVALNLSSDEPKTALRWQSSRQTGAGRWAASAERLQGSELSSTQAAINWSQGLFGANLGASLDDASGARQAQWGLRSAVAWADGLWAVSERVDGSFALFASTPEAGPLFVNPNGENYLARSWGRMPALVSQLVAHQPRSLALALPSLPADRDPGELFPIVQPGYRAGVGVRSGGKPVIGLELRLVDAQGTPLNPVGGRIEGGASAEPIPVFVGRDGRLRASGLSPGQWRLVLDTKPLRIHNLVIAEDQRGTVDLGTLGPE